MDFYQIKSNINYNRLSFKQYIDIIRYLSSFGDVVSNCVLAKITFSFDM